MSNKYAEIKRLLREIVKEDLNAQALIPVRGTVTKITGQSCVVKLYTGLEISDIKLKSVITESDDYLMLFPMIGSDVLIFDNTVIAVDKVAKFELIQNGLEVVFDSSDQKVSIKNENTSLLGLFNDLTALLKQLKVFTSTGPSGIPLPDTITKIEQLDVKVKQLLK